MRLTDKHVLVVGIAKSGISMIQTLNKLGAKITIHDSKTKEALGEVINELHGLYQHEILGAVPEIDEDIDLVVLSPGVPPNLPFLTEARQKGIPMIGELELAFQINEQPTYIGITGTNGKTTTTALTGAIFKAAGKDTRIVGNIGLPVISEVLTADKDTYMITEVSSFQLETIEKFKVKVGAVLNITPDHLNRHITMENYIAAKSNLFLNQDEHDFLILNHDNRLTRELIGGAKGQVYYFSHEVKPEKGMFISDGHMKFVDQNQEIDIISTDEIFIPGQHNLENAMAAALMALLSGIHVDVIRETLKTFRGVEHRIEYVDQIKGVTFYNDSKGTNPDASIVAVKSMKSSTVLIAGGMDKGSEFDTLIQSFTGHIKHLVLFGETKYLIKETAEKKGYKHIYVVDTLDEAVAVSWRLASEGWNILLSPACASWDMYPSFEVRGEHFKSLVKAIGEKG